jgi:hypothetical protein
MALDALKCLSILDYLFSDISINMKLPLLIYFNKGFGFLSHVNIPPISLLLVPLATS